MSLTLSMTAASGAFFVDHPYPRSNTISATSDGTTCRHSCRCGSSESLIVAPILLNGGRSPLSSELLGNTLSGPEPPLRHAVLPQTVIETVHDSRDCYPQAHDRIPNMSNESFQTVSLGSQSPSMFETFSGTSDPAAGEDDTAALSEDPLFHQKLTHLGISPNFDTVPFRRWLSKLRHPRVSEFSQSSGYGPLLGEVGPTYGNQRKSGSSHRVVTGVRTATMTLAGTSIAPRSWIGARFNHLRRSGNSSHDSVGAGPIMDEAAWLRAIQRRKILEELVESEESYVADLKVLTNVYFTLLASVCALSSQARALVRENLAEILHMHETLLGELHRVIPHSEYNQSHAAETPVYYVKGHVRWHSADSGIGLNKLKDSRFARRLRHSIDTARVPKQSTVGSTAEPKTAAAAAKVFGRFLPQFFAYEEYGAKYELMVQDLAATYKTLNTEQAFERGIEILSHTVESINHRDDHGRKGMTFADLVIKPIQRVCKYPLLFSDLAKYTPVADDPESHADVEKVLLRLKETTREINRATNDPSTRALIEKTWLLQDRLQFPDETVRSSKESRLLGHVLLCGVLHVAYQDKLRIKGRYMLCALFKAFVLLAVPRKGTITFGVVAVIPTTNISVEDADNGRGLQCHTAPFSWKLVFQADYRLFELILSACSPAEETQWKKQLNQRSCIENLDLIDGSGNAQDSCALLSLDLKAMGTLYGQPNTLARRMSIHRAATLGPKPHMSQVIIKNTESTEYSPHQSSTLSLPISRSKSVATTSHTQVLAPRRVERMNLETILADVWTRDLLPYPGMKPENSLKASANHVMRKLSIASLTSTFSRRSTTFEQVPRVPKLENFRQRCTTPTELGLLSAGTNRIKVSKQVSLWNRNSVHPSHVNPPVTVNFHKTPEMFLPPDFELKDPRVSKPPREKLTIRTVNHDGVSIEAHKKNPPQSRLQRSLSERMPAVKEVAENFKPRTPLSPIRLNAQKSGAPRLRRKVENGAKAPKPLSKQLRKLWG